MVQSNVLTFGNLPSRAAASPLLCQYRQYKTGMQVAKPTLRRLHHEHGLQHVDTLFGPAYKGIPFLCTAIALYNKYGVEVNYCFNRKKPRITARAGPWWAINSKTAIRC
ncbi:MAG: hypothetical protein ACLS9N_13250 [[Clostridium] leptum]